MAHQQPTTNPLDQLRDIHTPETQTFYEIAPFWWIVIILLIVFIIFQFVKWMKLRRKLALLKPAKAELKTIQQMVPDNVALASLSALLKRVSMMYFPRDNVASLSGIKWIDFLNQTCQQNIFDDEAKMIFSQTAYQPNQKLNDESWQKIILQSENVLDSLIRHFARENR